MHVEGNHSFILFLSIYTAVNDTEMENGVLVNKTGKYDRRCICYMVLLFCSFTK